MTTRTNSPSPDDQLPLDPDIEVAGSTPIMRPVHRRWRYIGLVAAGGFAGTAIRELLSTIYPAEAGISWSIFWINITGAFLLGILLEALAHRGPDDGGRRALRLLLGTGVLGGLTTYSTLAESTAALFLEGRGLDGTGYALLTVLSGAIATGYGLSVASWIRPAGAPA